jgi:hypothetical protein
MNFRRRRIKRKRNQRKPHGYWSEGFLEKVKSDNKIVNIEISEISLRCVKNKYRHK